MVFMIVVRILNHIRDLVPCPFSFIGYTPGSSSFVILTSAILCFYLLVGMVVLYTLGMILG